MCKSLIPFLVVALIVSILVSPGQTAFAQVISIPAEINKSFSPISILAGGISRLSVTIFNPNGFPLTNAAWTDNLIGVQTGLTIASLVGLTNSCGGSVSAPVGGTALSLSGGTVPAQSGSTPGSCTVSINVTSTSVDNLINTIPAGELISTGPGGINITNTTPASATLNVTGTPTPSVSKSFSPGTIWAGQTSLLSIVIRNNEQGRSLTQVSLIDNLPANIFLANPPNINTTGCGSPTFSPVPAAGDTSISITNGTIAPNSSCIITVGVTSSTQGAYINRIPVSSLGTQQGVTNSTAATARLNVRDIGVSKRFSSATFGAGSTNTLIITLQNPTSSNQTGVNVTDNLPTPLTVAGPATTTCGGTVTTTANTVSLTGGTIPAGSPTALGTCTISVPVTAPATASGTVTNTIPAGGVTTRLGVGNLLAASASVTITTTDVVGTKSFSPSTIAAGGNSRLRIDLFAPSDTDLTNFSFTDNLPAGLTVSNSTPAAVTGCGTTPPLVLDAPTGGTTISLSGGLILAGQRCRIDIYVTSSIPGPQNTPYTNIIPPTSITNNENRRPAADLTSNLIVTPNSALSIALVKGFDPLIVTGGAASTMSIELINPGNVTLTGIAFTDNMPNGMILANPVNLNLRTCGGTLSGVPGANTISFSGGSLPPLGRCTLTLSATITVNGNLTNSIAAGTVTTTNGVTNADPAEATLTNLPGASVSKFFSPNPIPAGSYSLLTITILNTGNIELAGLGLSDSLPAGLAIAGGSAPAPVNDCGGTLTAVVGTQLIELANGSLVGNASCTIEVPITGSNAGAYQNAIPAGALRTDPRVNVTNNLPASDTLVITGEPVVAGGGGGVGRGSGNRPGTIATTSLIPLTGLDTGFKPNAVTNLSDIPRETYTAIGDVVLEIPSLGVKIPVVGVPKKNGTWNVAWLGDQAGWLEGSAFPSWSGNSVLTGHVYLASGLPGPFVHLNKLKFGDKVLVYAFGQKFTFDVQANTIVNPNDRSIMKHEEKPWLTLVTCKDYDGKTGTYKKRVVVRAVLVDVRATK